MFIKGQIVKNNVDIWFTPEGEESKIIPNGANLTVKTIGTNDQGEILITFEEYPHVMWKAEYDDKIIFDAQEYDLDS